MTKIGNVDIGIGVDLMKVSNGDRLRLKDGRIGTVVENIADGQWVELSFSPDDVELVHSQDLDSVVTA